MSVDRSGPNPLDRFIVEHRGPLVVLRACRCCGWSDKIAAGRPGVGRGYGMREGNKSRGRVLQHVKECAAVAAAITKEPFA